MSTPKNPNRLLEALLHKYKMVVLDPTKAVETQILWNTLEKVASGKVKRSLGWEDPEVVGTVVSKAIMELPKVEHENLLGWFTLLVDRECMNVIRDNSVKKEVAICDVPEQQFVHEMDWSLLEDVKVPLQEDEQELLRMKLEGYTEAEIAAAVGVERGTIRARVLALVRNLRRRLGDAG